MIHPKRTSLTLLLLGSCFSFSFFMFPPYLQDGGIYLTIHPEGFHACNNGINVYKYKNTKQFNASDLYIQCKAQSCVPYRFPINRHISLLYTPVSYTYVGHISTLDVISRNTILCVVRANPELFDLKFIK